MSSATEGRPDGRTVPAETLALREATRALRLHLDILPIDFDLDTEPERFIAGLAFVSARQRYACAESLIGAGFGGTALGSLCRGLFADALRWLWIGADERRLLLLSGDLLLERSRLCTTLTDSNCSCPNFRRWLEPIAGLLPIVDALLPEAWAMPSENALLADFLATQASRPSGDESLLARAEQLLSGAELRGAALIAAHVGHGNYLGLQSSLSDDGAVGHDLRLDHEALYLQLGAAGAVATAIGSSAVADHWWPGEYERDQFLDVALALASEVSRRALDVHRLLGRRGRTGTPSSHAVPESFAPNPSATSSPPPLWPAAPYPQTVIDVAETYYALARSLPIDPWGRAEPTLHPLLGWTGALSNLESVFATYDQTGAGPIVVSAARALLEEAARTHWRYSVSDPSAFRARATQFFDKFRARRRKTINLLVGGGVPREDAEGFFALPTAVDPATITTDPTPGRLRIPSISEMLVNLGTGYPEPSWMLVAYSLLSQATHATPLGLMYSLSVRSDGQLNSGEIMNELLALSLDITCASSSVVLGVSALTLTDLSPEAWRYQEQLQLASLRVHDAARLVHGLD